ncbi:MAG: hypothetical protein HC904_14705 [Blastochloris sp.]|nr:hypothetical protein [Blastochloris sp.]
MNTSKDSTDSAIRRLTIAVWILSVLVAVNIVISSFSALFPPAITKRMALSLPGSFTPGFTQQQDDYKGFYDWPLEKQIDAASVIAVTKYEKDGDRYKAVISEILKQAPEVQFNYKVGDEYMGGGYYPKEGTSRGDGAIIFFTGSPSSMEYSCSFYGDRIAAFGDMPFEVLRKLINKQ